MTAITDAITLIDILKRGGTSDNAQLIRVANHFRTYAGSEFVAIDPENVTNEELAENVLLMFRRFGRSVLKGQGEAAQSITHDADVIAAGITAETDL